MTVVTAVDGDVTVAGQDSRNRVKAQIKNMILSSRADELGNATQINSEMDEHLEGIHYLGVMRGFVVVSVVKHTQEDTE